MSLNRAVDAMLRWHENYKFERRKCVHRSTRAEICNVPIQNTKACTRIAQVEYFIFKLLNFLILIFACASIIYGLISYTRKNRKNASRAMVYAFVSFCVYVLFYGIIQFMIQQKKQNLLSSCRKERNVKLPFNHLLDDGALKLQKSFPDPTGLWLKLRSCFINAFIFFFMNVLFQRMRLASLFKYELHQRISSFF